MFSSLLGVSTATLERVTLKIGKTALWTLNDIKLDSPTFGQRLSRLDDILVQLQKETGGRLEILIVVEGIGAMKRSVTARRRRRSLGGEHSESPLRDGRFSASHWNESRQFQAALMQALQRFLPEMHRQGTLVLAPCDPESIRATTKVVDW